MFKVIPFGDRILVKRRPIGEKAGSILLPQEVQERLTDLADVVFVPNNTFADEDIIKNADEIISSLIKSAKEGNAYAMNTLLEFNEYLKKKSIKVGDTVVMGKYIGTDITATGEKDSLTLLFASDVIGLVVKE